MFARPQLAGLETEQPVRRQRADQIFIYQWVALGHASRIVPISTAGNICGLSGLEGIAQANRGKGEALASNPIQHCLRLVDALK